MPTDEEQPRTVYVVYRRCDAWGSGGYPIAVVSTEEAARALVGEEDDYDAFTVDAFKQQDGAGWRRA